MPTMEILVLGDGAYVFAVLNAVAGITSYNMLGALGAVVAILLMAIKGASGQPVQPGSLLVSVVLFWVVFVPRVDRVVVQEIMVQPGGLPPRSFVVDNVPFGLAAGGFLMSQLGAKITSLNETSFGSADDTARGTTGGLGRNLVLLNAIQSMANDPRFTDAPKDDAGSGYLDRYRHNMGNHLRDCYFPIANNNSLSVRSAMNKPGLTGVVNAATANPAAMTTFLGEDLTPKSVTCAEMNGLIGTSANVTSALESAFDQASKAAGKSVTAKEISLAFSTFTNKQAENVGAMIATSIMRSLVAQAAASGSLSPRDAQSVIMLEEASAKRNVQWAAEESLFIRILRPIVGFFEALFYALAPIMAFVITLGPFGWSLVGKYAMLTVWVALWFPMLAITQLYSNVQVSGFFERMMSARSADGTEFYSPEQLHGISLQAMDALGAASALTAATPALAMSLIFGGAVSMSYLAGRLQGSDMIDEGKVAPNASSVAPIASMGSVGTGTSGGGTVLNGAPVPKISAQSVAQTAATVAKTQSETDQQAFARALATTYGVGSQATQAASEAVTNGLTRQEVEGLRETVVNSLKKTGASDHTIKAAKEMSEQDLSHVAASITASVGGKVPLTETGVVGKVDTGHRRQNAETESVGSSSNAKMEIARAVASDKAAEAAISSTVATGILRSVNNGFTSSQGVTDTETLSRTASATITSPDQYTRLSGVSASTSMQDDVPLNAAAERFYGDDSLNGAVTLGEYQAMLEGNAATSGMLGQARHDIGATGLAEASHKEFGATFLAMQTAVRSGVATPEMQQAYHEMADAVLVDYDRGTGGAHAAVGAGAAWGAGVDAKASTPGLDAATRGAGAGAAGAYGTAGRVAAGQAAIAGQTAPPPAHGTPMDVAPSTGMEATMDIRTAEGSAATDRHFKANADRVTERVGDGQMSGISDVFHGGAGKFKPGNNVQSLPTDGG